MDILITSELLQLSASVAKILSAPEGNAVMVGRAGIGRKSAVKIVSSLQSARLIIPISRAQPQFNADLKSVSDLIDLMEKMLTPDFLGNTIIWTRRGTSLFVT